MNSEVRLLTQADWNEMYLPGKQAGDLLLHSLIAQDTADEAIIPQISRNKNLIAACDERHDGLTPLIIATMKGREPVVSALLKCCGKNPNVKRRLINARDAHEWSALLHAYLSSKRIFDLLKSNGASLEVSIPLGDIDLLRTVKVAAHTLGRVSVATSNGALVSLKDFGIKNIGLEAYRDIPYYSDDALHILKKLRIDGVPDTHDAVQESKMLYRYYLSKKMGQNVDK